MKVYLNLGKETVFVIRVKVPAAVAVPSFAILTGLIAGARETDKQLT